MSVHTRTRSEQNRPSRLKAGLTSLVVVIALSVVLVGSSAGATRGSAAKPTLSLGVPTAGIASLDPAKGNSSYSYPDAFFNLGYDTILHMNTKGQFEPDLASSWHFYTTGRGFNKDFEFTLRPNRRFSDGEAVTAQAVVGWFNYLLTSSSPFATFLGPTPTFEAKGKYTVRIHTKVGTPNLPLYLSDVGTMWGFVAAPQAVANPSLMVTGSYGAGQYMADPAQTVVGDHYTFVPNPYFAPNYPKEGAAKFSQVTVKVIPVASTMLQALQSGQLDAVVGDVSTLPVAESSGLGVGAASTNFITICLNPQVEPKLKDVRVRQALNYAIDRKTLSAAIVGKHGVPTSEFIVADADAGLANYYPYNPAKAKALLAAAGYPNGFNLDLFAFTNTQQYMEAAAKYLNAVGVTTNITITPSAGTFVATFKNHASSGTNASINTTPSRWGVFLDPKGPFDSWGFDPTLSSLYYKGFHSKDSLPVWKQLWTRVTKQAVFIPLTTTPVSWYWNRSKVSGVVVPAKRFATPLVSEWVPK